MKLALNRDGAVHHANVLAADEMEALREIASRVLIQGAGTRLYGELSLVPLLSPQGTLGRLAGAELGPRARPVRALLFDKTPEANWAVAWHQDRTIAVKARAEVEGFGPWSIKAGAAHVEPPFKLIERMVTLRAHIDNCGADNAPLLIVRGSHKLGRIPAAEVRKVAEAGQVIPCLAGSGDVWLYSTPIVHASRTSKVTDHRRVLQVDFSADGLPGGLEWLGV